MSAVAEGIARARGVRGLARPLRLAAPLLAAFSLPQAHAADAPSWASVAPIFAERCVICHSGAGAPLGLRLDSLEGLRAGSDKGPVAVAGDAEGSELIKRLRGESLPRMPLTGPPFLEEAQVATIAAWIEAGLPEGAADEAPPAMPSRPALPAPGEPVTWTHVESIFLQRCVKCHKNDGLRGPPPEGLRLETYELALRGGERVAVVPGNPGASELVRRIRGQALPRMPFDGPPYLDEDQIRVVADWIAQGAPDADGRRAPVPVGARVRLHGRLTARWALDGTPLTLTPGARIKERIDVGSAVRVRGRIGPGGEILVERIQRR